MKLYRIYTADNPNLISLVAAHFQSATISPAKGLWNGTVEYSVIIEVVGTPATTAVDVERLARAIAHANRQDAVLVTAIAVAESYQVDSLGWKSNEYIATASSEVAGNSLETGANS